MVCQQMGWDASNKSKSRPKPNRDAELDKVYASYESGGCIFYEDSIGISGIKGQRRGIIFILALLIFVLSNRQKQTNVVYKIKEIHDTKSQRCVLHNQRNIDGDSEK